MVLELKLHKVGDSIGMILPDEALAYLKSGEGDSVCLTENADGSLRIAPSKVESARQMEVAENIIRRYPETLRDLAK